MPEDRATGVVRLDVMVERHHPEMPRYLVVPSSTLEGWSLTATTIVEGTFGGHALGRRSLKRWGEDRWFLELPERWCEATGVGTGDRAQLAFSLASTDLPRELAELLESSARARTTWDGMTPSQQRVLREDVLAAKRRETRARRARKALEGPCQPRASR